MNKKKEGLLHTKGEFHAFKKGEVVISRTRKYLIAQVVLTVPLLSAFAWIGLQAIKAIA